ncbi:unnamed protein product [Cuscuta campestris]|uniref:Uncharacterized protein n=1 Tax=Cuscuta campestris TaxID=132261 RepID=A0A484KZW8_9ASTE|nr:unnamed protein product [Cuscuta campestris]
MWVEVICSFAIFRLLKRFFREENDVREDETSYANALFSVTRQLEKIYGGKAFVGLLIPDVDSGSRRSIDIVLLTRRYISLSSPISLNFTFVICD